MIGRKKPLIIDGIVSFIMALIALWLFFKVANMISRILKRIMLSKSIDSAVSAFTCSLVQAFLKISIVIAVLGYVGVETGALIAVLGAAGLAIGFSLQNSLANFASGILIIVFRPFKAGDFIEAGGVSNNVDEI
jgi:small conductance mechanosensitive channel